MPIPLAIPLAVGAAGALYQGISGAVQTGKAKNELEDMGERPDYVIPAGVTAASALAGRMAQDGLPQASMNMFDAQQNQMQAQTASNMGDLRAGLSGVQGAAGAGSQAARQLAVQDAQTRIQNQRANIQQQNMLAQYQERAQEENVLGRYDVARAEALGRLDRGQAEKMAGMQSLMNVAGAAMSLPSGGAAGAGSGAAVRTAASTMGGGATLQRPDAPSFGSFNSNPFLGLGNANPSSGGGFNMTATGGSGMGAINSMSLGLPPIPAEPRAWGGNYSAMGQGYGSFNDYNLNNIGL